MGIWGVGWRVCGRSGATGDRPAAIIGPLLEKFLQTLMDGTAVGSLYALIALGYTMVYGILKFINFAHSDVFVMGAWVSYSAARAAGWTQDGTAVDIPPWLFWMMGSILAAGALATLTGHLLQKVRVKGIGTLAVMIGAWGLSVLGLVLVCRALKGSGQELLAGGVVLLIAMLSCGAMGFCIERMAYKPLRGSPRLNVLITAIGVSLFLQNLGQLPWMYGTSPQRMPSILPDRVLFEIAGTVGERGEDGSVIWWQTDPVRVRLLDVIAGGTAVVLMICLDRLVYGSKIGRAMRAVSFNPQTASLMGIPVDRVISFTFVLGAMLAAAAGFLYGQKYPGLLQPASATWVLLGLKAFVAAVVGGIGNVRGAMLGGLLIGLIEFFGAAYLSSDLRDVYVFALLIVVLLLRPSGILGRATVEKV